jgi:signal transduction histidine kinase
MNMREGLATLGRPNHGILSVMTTGMARATGASGRVVHADDSLEFELERDSDSHERWMDVAVLSVIATGASIEEIATSLSAGDQAIGQDDVARLVANLEQRGLLRTSAGSADAAGALTESGRRLIMAQIGAWMSAATALETERRRVERLRTDLLSTISHELRTPLTLIRTSIGLLLDSDPDEEMRQRLLRNIKGSTDRMHALVGDLLDLARLSNDRLELQVRRVDLDELVNGAVSLMRPLIEAKEQRVTLEIPSPAPAVLGDYRRLERVLLNLLSNANKFAPMGTAIAVTVNEDAREVTIAVQDAGPGITAEGIPHLFEQFFTERTSSSRHNIGAGLGLPIAKGIIEAHGGRIWVESLVGVGTTVWFALPKNRSQERPDESLGRR